MQACLVLEASAELQAVPQHRPVAVAVVYIAVPVVLPQLVTRRCSTDALVLLQPSLQLHVMYVEVARGSICAL